MEGKERGTRGVEAALGAPAEARPAAGAHAFPSSVRSPLRRAFEEYAVRKGRFVNCRGINSRDMKKKKCVAEGANCWLLATISGINMYKEGEGPCSSEFAVQTAMK